MSGSFFVGFSCYSPYNPALFYCVLSCLPTFLSHSFSFSLATVSFVFPFLVLAFFDDSLSLPSESLFVIHAKNTRHFLSRTIKHPEREQHCADFFFVFATKAFVLFLLVSLIPRMAQCDASAGRN